MTTIVSAEYNKIADGIYNIALVYERRGEWHKAIELLQHGLFVVNGAKANQRHRARLQCVLGSILWKVGEMETAVSHLDEARAISESIMDSETLGAALYHLGEIQYINQFVMLADASHRTVAYHERALHIRRQHNDWPGIAQSLSRIGVIYDHLGEPEKARTYYHEALALCDEHGLRREKIRPLTHIGSHHQYSGNLDEALAYYQRAYQQNLRVDHQEGLVFSIANLAAIQFKRNHDADEVMPHYQKALELAEQIDFKLAIATVLFLMSRLYEAIDMPEMACRYYQKIIELAEPLGYQAMIKPAQKRLRCLISIQH
ncbi:MAG: tetratricopeptide repeat protein [Chloroflexi bacterium]|nr:tetratricopeptide repeat protein [Chloroflexota bacterium]